MGIVRNKLIILLFVLAAGTFNSSTKAQQAVVSIQVFYDELSPYGQWVNYSNYGYVWIPTVGPDFFPYSTRGHWCYTHYGWTWVSDYNWGWAPFHYGRWVYDGFYGWLWVPDIEWGPAWVVWRRTPGYYGWMPLGPGYNHKNSFSNTYYGRRESWTFAEERSMGRKDMEKHYAPRRDHDKLIKNSTVINNTHKDNDRNATYISGPAKEDVEKIQREAIQPVTVEERLKPGQYHTNNRMSVYRPRMARNTTVEPKPAPTKVTDIKQVKPASERIPENANNVYSPVKNERANKPTQNNIDQPRTTEKPQTPVPNNRKVITPDVRPQPEVPKPKPNPPAQSRPERPQRPAPNVDRPRQQNIPRPAPPPSQPRPNVSPQKPPR